MDLLLKPKVFDSDHTSPTAAEEWNHWEKTLTNFINRVERKAQASTPPEEIDKLEILTNLISPSIYKHISQCNDYKTAIETLTSLFVRPSNEIFARHQLATRKQKQGESLDEYIQALKVLSKDCQFKSVTAEQNAEYAIRDAFISGICSQLIRTRLLENASLTLQDAFNQARSLDLAQKHSETYQSYSPVGASVSAPHSEPANTANYNDESSLVLAAGNYNQGQRCYYCAGRIHPRYKCPARDAECTKCFRKGHFSKACQSGKNPNYRPTKGTAASVGSSNPPTLYSISSFNSKVLSTSSVNRIPAKTLADSGANITCIDETFVTSNQIYLHPTSEEVKLASSHSAKSVGYIIADIKFKGHVYRKHKITVLPNLVAELVLGTDIMQLHESVQMEFGGKRPPLVLSSLKPIRVTAPTLFANLTKDCRPIAEKGRKYSTKDQIFIQSEVKKLLDDGIIEPSRSPWRAQLLVHRSENHKTRMCVDYSHTINQFTLLDAYPVPRVSEVISKMAAFKVFSSLDLQSAYHQVSLCESDKPFTAFQAGNRLFQFTRIPFGLRNSGAVFQRILDSIVDENNLQGVSIYCDNIYIGGMDQSSHDANLKAFLDVAEKMNITFNKGKSVYSTDTLSILGTQLSGGVMKPDPQRVNALKQLPEPKTMRELKRVIGMFAHYSQWIPNFSDNIQPLVQIKSLPLSDDAKTALANLKVLLSEAALQPVTEGIPFTVETDASDFAIGATLSQQGRPVAFHSRSLQGSEKHHSAVEKEAYSIVEALRKWHHFLVGTHFTLITDQKSVAFMFNIKHQSKIKNEKILRWRIELSSLSYDIIHRPGKENVVPDALSRTVSSVNSLSLKELHEALCHPGITRLNHYVRSKNLPYSLTEIKSVTSECRTCAKIKPNFFKPESAKLIKSTQPWERLSIDFKGPLPSQSKNRYILTVVDEFSRYPFAFPCSNMESSTVIKCFVQLFSIFGMPGFVHSDRGPSLISSELRSFLHSYGIATSNTTPYNPRGNGQCERYNGVIWNGIMLALESRKLPLNCWEEVLTDVLHSIRSLLCTATNQTPHERMFHHPRRSTLGTTLPGWLCNPGPVLLKNYKRASKYEPLVTEVELLHANPNYALVKHPDGKESNVSLRDLAPTATPMPSPYVVPQNPVPSKNLSTDQSVPPSCDLPKPLLDPMPSSENNCEQETNNENVVEPPEVNNQLRRTQRSNAGTPPVRYSP